MLWLALPVAQPKLRVFVFLFLLRELNVGLHEKLFFFGVDYAVMLCIVTVESVVEIL